MYSPGSHHSVASFTLHYIAFMPKTTQMHGSLLHALAAPQVTSLLRSAANSINLTGKDTQKLANEQTVKLSKSGLGAAATVSSVLCAAYAKLGRDSETVTESRFW